MSSCEDWSPTYLLFKSFICDHWGSQWEESQLEGLNWDMGWTEGATACKAIILNANDNSMDWKYTVNVQYLPYNCNKSDIIVSFSGDV